MIDLICRLVFVLDIPLRDCTFMCFTAYLYLIVKYISLLQLIPTYFVFCILYFVVHPNYAHVRLFLS